jgi:hypothetical protein
MATTQMDSPPTELDRHEASEDSSSVDLQSAFISGAVSDEVGFKMVTSEEFGISIQVIFACTCCVSIML